MATDVELTAEFKTFTDKVVKLANNVNKARRLMKDRFNTDGKTIETHGDTHTGDGRAIRDYECSLEELKGFVQNKSLGQLHNDNLKRTINGETHAIRALEVELVHPVVRKEGEQQVLDKDGKTIDEYLITGVVVRGLISIDPADGNEAPTYSSKSSSSAVPIPPTT